MYTKFEYEPTDVLPVKIVWLFSKKLEGNECLRKNIEDIIQIMPTYIKNQSQISYFENKISGKVFEKEKTRAKAELVKYKKLQLKIERIINDIEPFYWDIYKPNGKFYYNLFQTLETNYVFKLRTRDLDWEIARMYAERILDI